MMEGREEWKKTIDLATCCMLHIGKSTAFRTHPSTHMQLAPIERPDSLQKAAYSGIKNLLLTGQLQPQTLYSATRFADILAVSRTPVREALLQLVAEGYLIAIDGKGFKIRTFTEKEIMDYFETRKIIESYVIEQFVENRTPDDISQLRDYLAQMEKCATENDAVGFLEADKNFHLYPIHRHNNQHLQMVMDNLRDLISVIGQQAIGREGRYQEVLQEHESIIEAIVEKNSRKAVACMKNHLSVTEAYLVNQYPR